MSPLNGTDSSLWTWTLLFFGTLAAVVHVVVIVPLDVLFVLFFTGERLVALVTVASFALLRGRAVSRVVLGRLGFLLLLLDGRQRLGVGQVVHGNGQENIQQNVYQKRQTTRLLHVIMDAVIQLYYY